MKARLIRVSREPLFWILTAAALLYLALLPLYFVGYFLDDAIYIVGARSLLHGSYSASFLWNNPPLTRLPPGFSTLLMPFVLLADPRWALLKIVPFSITLISIRLFWALVRVWVSPRQAWLITALYAFNPIVAIFSGAVMADSFCSLLLMGSFLLLRRVAAGSKPWRRWALAGLLGWVGVTRVLAGVVIPSAGAALWTSGKRKAAWMSTGLALLPIILFAYRNHVVSGTGSDYMALWRNQLSFFAEHPLLIIDNWHRMLHTLVVSGLLGLRWGRSPGVIIVGSLLIAACLGVMVYGFIVTRRERSYDRAVIHAIGLFCLGYFGVVLNWTFVDGRFALPLIPWMTVFLVVGADRLLRRYARGIPIARVGLSVWIVSLIWGNKAFLLAAYYPTASSRMPAATFQWMREHVPVEAAVLNCLPSVYLYTGCRGVSMPKLLDPDEWRYALLKQNVAFFYYRHPPPPDLQMGPFSGDRTYARVLRWALNAPKDFVPVYVDPNESTVLYHVIPDARFQQAMDLYHRGLGYAEAGQMQAALTALRQALRLEPRLAPALNAIGALQLNSKGDLREAEKNLSLALAVRPDHPYALFNRAIVYEKMNQPGKAAALLEEAARRITADEFPDVYRDVARERMRLSQ